MSGAVVRIVRAVRRQFSQPFRRVAMRLLRPVFARIDTHMQWLFDRQQEDRVRILRLEQQIKSLQQQVSALQRQASAQRSYGL